MALSASYIDLVERVHAIKRPAVAGVLIVLRTPRTRDIAANAVAEDQNLDESRLIVAAQAGDPAAFEELIQRQSEIAFRVAYLITGSTAEAEDAVQDAFWSCYRALHKFRPEAPFRPWLLRIVSNEAKSHSRSELRRLSRQSSWLESDPHVEADDVADEALKRERRNALLRGIRELRPEEQFVIQLRYYLDLSTAEAAEVIGCPEGTVKSRLSRALINLRARVGVELG